MRRRLFLAFFAAILLSIILLGFGFQLNTLRTVNDFISRGGIAGVDHIVIALEDHYAASHSWEGSEDLLLLPMPSGSGMGMGKGKGKGPFMAPQTHLAISDPAGVLVDGSNLGKPLSSETLNSAIPLQENGTIIGYLVPTQGTFAVSQRYQERLASQFNQTAIRTILVTGSISLLLSLVAGYFMLRPIRQLTQAAEHLASGDLSARVSIQGKDEFARLGSSFNHMAESLQNAEEKRRALTADIAHELRTPLAVQRANLEAIQDGVYSLTMDNINAVMEQNHQLTHLVEDLRLLAMTEENALSLEIHKTDINNLIQQIAAQVKSQADIKDITLTYEPYAEFPEIYIDPRRIEQVVMNLLQNALFHTPVGKEIQLSLNYNEDQVFLVIHDSGPGIPENALPHIFDRFYRTDSSRARDQGGSGLGLTIARQLARAQGGDLTAANHPQGGAVFTLQLPRKVPS